MRRNCLRATSVSARRLRAATKRTSSPRSAGRRRDCTPGARSSSLPTATCRRAIARCRRRKSRRCGGPSKMGGSSGVAVLAGRARQLVAAPIMGSAPIGWVVFAADLDASEMLGLERLSAIPLRAAVVAFDQGRWREASGSMPALDPRAAARAQAVAGKSATFEMNVGDVRSIGLAEPLPTFADGDRAFLMLAYPKAAATGGRAQAPVRAWPDDDDRPAAGRHCDMEGRASDYPAAGAPRRGCRAAGFGRARPGPGSRKRRVGAARHQLQPDGRQDRRTRAADHPARVQRRPHWAAQPDDVPAAARPRVPRRAERSRSTASTSTSSR